MLQRVILLLCFVVILFSAVAQQSVQLKMVKENYEVLPGKVLNIAYFLTNDSKDTLHVATKFEIPEGWKIIARQKQQNYLPPGKKFSVLSVQVPSSEPVGTLPITIEISSLDGGELLCSAGSSIQVQEVEKIEIQPLEHSSYVFSGAEIEASYLLHNLGNTRKTIFLETQNCEVAGTSELSVPPGESVIVKVRRPTSMDYAASEKEFYTLRATAAGSVLASASNWTQVFPAKRQKKDLFHRLPVNVSATYLAANQNDEVESTYQLQVFGSGTLDVNGEHRLEFLARGPNNTDLSYLGLYDQYYVSYENKNLELFAGQKSYVFTPLTESSRYGWGAEGKVNFNNGLALGAVYVEPRFYEEIVDEMAGVAGFAFNDKNKLDLYYISKQFVFEEDRTQLASFVAELNPFNGTELEAEFSRGFSDGYKDNAYRFNLNTHFSVFNLAANYYNTGKRYPGYYNNSKFYSGNLSARLSTKMSIGMHAREDFVNAQLDTFFVTAPYTRSYQGFIEYNIAKNSYLRFYLRQYERKDRLSREKFHYETNSGNVRFSQKLNKFRYNLTGEVGVTKNFLLEPGENEQNSYRGRMDLTYRFNPRHSVRMFGTWSNINQFVSGKQQNFTAGFSLTSRISKNFNANFYLQNAYDVDDYYRNRNLMQLNLDYRFLKRHSIALRSFYTLFKNELEDPEFTVSATYAFQFGIPLKRVIKAGTIKGVVTNSENEPVEGVWVTLLGETAVTDKTGAYVFDYVQPGKHLLSFDESSFQLNEISNVQNPLEVEVFEDQETTVDMQVLKGAVLSGKIRSEKSAGAPGGLDKGVENVIVELKTRHEVFRISTDKNGHFAFPLVRPGTAEFKVYVNSIPTGYKLNEPSKDVVLQPGESKELDITLTPKSRNIIFKSSGLTVLKKGSTLKKSNSVQAKSVVRKQSNAIFYSVQIGAFKRKLNRGSSFFKGEKFYFEKQIDNLHKYFIGRFTKVEEAKQENNRLSAKFKNTFVVVIFNDDIVPLNQFKESSTK